jgi:site-specific DNA-methyltransferase (adenine-specific)
MAHVKIRAPRNKTIELTPEQCAVYRSRLLTLQASVSLQQVLNRTIHQDLFTALDYIPAESVDLVVVDPPYNLTKSFNSIHFTELSSQEYEEWLETWLPQVAKIMKKTASIYICGDWRSSAAIQRLAERLFIVQNRITWEREKGRGAKSNWKNCSEDIWFCTKSKHYTFNSEAVKLKRKVIAPYTLQDGQPKDWHESDEGRFRLTYPSNLWTDLTVPFWSMPENTDHPTQKPEKLLAKIILASSQPGDVVFDPFLGSGTTSVVAKKLERSYIGIEIDEYYCCLAEHRLQMVDEHAHIQGYADGVFWERNTVPEQQRIPTKHSRKGLIQDSLFVDE